MPDLNEVVASSLMIPRATAGDGLEYNSIKEWDSIAHMSLIAELEERYDVMLETDDIVAMSSVGKIREILKRYGADV